MPIFGQMLLTGGSTTQVTNGTPGTFDVMDAWDEAEGSNGLSRGGVQPLSASNKITIEDPGIYWVDFKVTYPSVAVAQFTAKAYWNAVAQPQLQDTLDAVAITTDQIGLRFSGLLDVTQGNTDLDVRIACDLASQNFVPVNASLTVFRIAST